MKPLLLLLLAALGPASALATDLTITSFDLQGRLVGIAPSTNALYRIEWASHVTGPWTNFQSLTRLDAIEPTGSVFSVQVPLFYRVAQEPVKDFRLEGLYRYTGYDTNGNLLVVGWWTVGVQTNQVSGTWTLGYAGSDPNVESIQNVGPQIGQGKWEGQFDVSQVSVNLNPGWADNNIFVHGQRTNSHYAGQWSWSTFPGHRSGGTFVLERVSTVP